MFRKKWLWAGMLAVPLAVGGGVAIAATQVHSFTCPFSGKVITWGNCGSSTGSTQEDPSYSCPVTTEEPAGESCCSGGE